MEAFSYFPGLTAREDLMATFGPESMSAARRHGAKAARRGHSPDDSPYPVGSCASTAWSTGFRRGLSQRVVYQVNLIINDTVIDAGHTTICKHAIHGAYESLTGIPQGEVCVRVNGRLVFWLHTNFRGEIDEIESHFRRDGVVLSLNPNWKRWPQIVGTPKVTAQEGILRL